MTKKCPKCGALSVDSALACGECGASLESVRAEIAKRLYIIWPTWWGLGEPMRLSKSKYIILTIAVWVLIGLAVVLIASDSIFWATVLVIVCAVIWIFWWLVGLVAASDASDKASKRHD